MKQHLIPATVAVAVVSIGTAPAQEKENRIKKSADATFVTKAAQGGMAEVELGKLATQTASNDKVKQFGQRMVDDHTKAGDELKAIAAQKGMTIPSDLSSKDAATKNRLSGLNGAAFDRAYMQDMVNDHKADIAEFQKEADHGTDPDVKAFAQKTLPTLQEHLRMAQDALAAVKQ